MLISNQWVWLVLASLVVIFGRIYINFVQDDAYITYRYARNLASGLGMVYNPGEWVLGTTTPLYTLLLAGFKALTGLPIETSSKLINILCLWASAGFLFEISKPNQRLFGITIAILFITNPILPHSIGMESLLLVFLMLFTVWSYTKDKFWLASITAGLLMITRFEMILVVIILSGHYLIVRRRIPFWLWLAFFIVIGWILYAFAAFGTPIPQTVYAKLAASRVPFLLGAALYWATFGRSFHPIHLLLFFLFLGLVSLLDIRKLNLSHLLILVISGLYFVVASLLAGSFPWYYVPLIPAFDILIAYGVGFFSNAPGLVRVLAKFSPSFNRVPKILFISISALLIGFQMVLWYIDFKEYGGGYLDYRKAPYQEAAAWLNQHAMEGQSLAAPEIGYLGYFTNLHIIDLYGLVTPGLNFWLEDGVVETLRQTLRIYAPDYVLIKANQPQIEVMNSDPRYQSIKVFYPDYLLYIKQR